MREIEISAQRHRNYSLFTFHYSLFTAAPGPPACAGGGKFAWGENNALCRGENVVNCCGRGRGVPGARYLRLRERES